MKRQAWIFIFAFALTANITGGFLKDHLIDYVSKPLIVFTLIGYFLSQTNKAASSLKKWIVLALGFSWAGDILLMFQQKDPLFFLLGLSSFLVAHLFYILFFHRVRVREKVKGNVWLLLIVAVYYVALIAFLSPYLGDMKLPVRIYGIVISFMLMLALHMFLIKQKVVGKLMVAGAVLFIMSDSILAINKFYHPFEVAGLAIMLTYGMAQLFIIEGAARYITSDYKG